EQRLHASGKPSPHPSELQHELEQADAALRALFADVQALKDGRHAQGEQMYRRVYRLHERLVALRSEHALLRGSAAPRDRLPELRELRELPELRELRRWVEERARRVAEAEWGGDVPAVQAQLDAHRALHRSVCEFRAAIQSARDDEV
ncbi:UNVERIFIED_CONTAM: hypothetical protein H355_012381, partial [Colinus virginianus]